LSSATWARMRGVAAGTAAGAGWPGCGKTLPLG